MAFPRREAIVRLTAVTALVLFLGAAAGALVGFTFTAVGDAVLPGTIIGSRMQVYGVGAMLGAIFGACVGTPIALIMLRRVPLWRATVETAAAAGLGTVVGTYLRLPWGFAWVAILFALLAAWRLRRAYAPAPAKPETTGR